VGEVEGWGRGGSERGDGALWGGAGLAWIRGRDGEGGGVGGDTGMGGGERMGGGVSWERWSGGEKEGEGVGDVVRGGIGGSGWDEEGWGVGGEGCVGRDRRRGWRGWLGWGGRRGGGEGRCIFGSPWSPGLLTRITNARVSRCVGGGSFLIFLCKSRKDLPKSDSSEVLFPVGRNLKEKSSIPSTVNQLTENRGFPLGGFWAWKQGSQAFFL